MQGGNQSLNVLKNVQFGQEIISLSAVAYITADLKKLVRAISRWFYYYRK